MRVISGLRRGHKLKAPKGDNVRPTEGRVKEALFNILGPIPTEAIVLDVFAGTGSIGIEFLSRGAKKAYFTDTSMESINAIEENLEHTKLKEQSEVIKRDGISFIKNMGRRDLKVDYIFIDPPFAKTDLIEKTMKEIIKSSILKENGLVIVEHVYEFDLVEGFKLIDNRNYGKKLISFYKTLEMEEENESNISR